MYFIDDDNVLRAKAVEIRPPNSKEVRRWKVTISDDEEHVVHSGTVDYTYSMLADFPAGSKDLNLRFHAIRSIAFKKPSNPEPGITHCWHTNNCNILMEFNKYTDDQLDYEIKKKVFKFQTKFPGQPLQHMDLMVSINADPRRITSRITAIAKLGNLRRRIDGGVLFNAEIYKSLQEYFMKTGFDANETGYFKQVDLPPQYNEPYVFVLMPLRDEEYPQDKYYNLIQPELQKGTGINCWRATDEQNRRLITDQIYSQIVKSEICVAEISTLNPNVLIEIGIALTLKKEVYLFHNLNILPSDKIPFYLDKVPLDGYKSDEEFAQKLGQVKLPR